MLKIQNVRKSDKVAQLNNVSVTNNNGRYVNIGTASHNQYNNEVLMLQYTKYTKYQKNTGNNVDLFNATEQTIDFTRFETIGNEVVICNCITMHDIIDAYANGSIQDWYENFCNSHSHKKSVILARFLSAIGIEVWRNVECYGGIYKGKYMVSNLGRVLSLNKKHFGKIVKQYDNGYGYLRVQLSYNGQVKDIRVNRLVALTFYGEPTEQLDCCHSNTNKTDNRLFNLEFKTHIENIMNPITQRKAKETLKSKAESKADKSATTTPKTKSKTKSKRKAE